MPDPVAAERFPHLFDPVRIGNVTVPNRLVQAAHFTGYDMLGGEPGERHGAYLAARARGGVGMVISDGGIGIGYRTGVGKVRLGLANELGQLDPDVIEKSRSRNRILTRMVHEEGAKVFCQLKHANGRMQLAGNTPLPGFVGISASQTSDFRSGMTAHELEPEELAEISRLSGEAAAVIRDSGFDGLEFRAHGGYLFQQFLSPMSNLREDEYGGSRENRMRFVVEALRSCRQAIGDDFPMGIRLIVDEDYEGGIDTDEGVELAREFAATGLLDYISINVGITTVDHVFPDYTHEPGFMRGLGARVRKVVDGLPVMIVGRFNEVDLADQAIAAGEADMVAMVRALIADPDLPRKAREGRADEIRPCVGANDACTFHALWGVPISCVHNPQAGRELDLGAIPAAETKKRVVVVGGGPGGMKAAEVAAQRGHEVVLFERLDELGGQVRLQSRVASRSEYGRIADHLVRRIEALGVDVRLGVRADAAVVLAERPDAVILAIGSEPVRTGFTNLTPAAPGLPGAELDHVLTEFDVLAGAATGERVLIVEDCSGGDYKVSLTAEHLADRGVRVAVTTTDSAIGTAVPWDSNGRSLQARLAERRVEVHPFTGVRRISSDGVEAYDLFTGSGRQLGGFDNVVLVVGHRTDRELYRELRGDVDELYEIGDALAPRTVRDAISGGFDVALEI